MPAAPQSIIDTRRHQMFPVLESADIERVRRFGHTMAAFWRPVRSTGNRHAGPCEQCVLALEYAPSRAAVQGCLVTKDVSLQV
jgi:hypothetical protein